MDGDKCFLPCRICNGAAGGGVHLSAFSSSPGWWLCKDAQPAENKKGSGFLLLSTRSLADPADAADRSGDFRLPLTDCHCLRSEQDLHSLRSIDKARGLVNPKNGAIDQMQFEGSLFPKGHYMCAEEQQLFAFLLGEETFSNSTVSTRSTEPG